MNELKPCRYGPMVFNQNDRYIGRSLQVYGEFSEGECQVFRQFVRPGATVVEVGANIGSHTVPLAQLVGTRGCIHAFEPQRIVYQTLCANIALNNLTNVYAYQLAVSDRKGSLFVPKLDYGQLNNFGGLSLGEYNSGEPVAMIHLDSLELPTLQLLKLDVEGMEHSVLMGGLKTIQRCKPILYVENDREEKSSQLIQAIDDLGYDMYWHLVPLFNRDNFFGVKENIFGGLVSKNMICIHKSIPHSINAPKVQIENPS